MKANFRQVYVFNLDVTAQRRDAVIPTLETLIAVLERRRAAGQATLAIDNGDVHLTLAPIFLDQARQFASLLIRHSDRYAADAVYSDIVGDTFTSHPKGAREGGETGIHVFLSTAPEQGFPGRYTCIIEKVPGLTVALVRRFLNRVIHDEYSADPDAFSYPHPGGQRTRAGAPAMVQCLPRCDFEGRPSEQLARDVQQGKLTGIVLKRAVAHTPVGGVPYLTKKEATLALEIDQGNLGANIWGDVRRALAAEAGDYPTAQVSIRLPQAKRSVSVNVDSANGAPLTELYVKSFDVPHINPPMAQSARDVVRQFADRVERLLIDERNI